MSPYLPPEALVTSPVDSCFKLLRLLSNMADMNKSLPEDRQRD